MRKQRRKDRKKSAVLPIKDDKRHAAIAKADYLLAAQRGFCDDTALDDWLRAEAEVNARLPGGG